MSWNNEESQAAGRQEVWGKDHNKIKGGQESHLRFMPLALIIKPLQLVNERFGVMLTLLIN